jgi:hypothetical protein
MAFWGHVLLRRRFFAPSEAIERTRISLLMGATEDLLNRLINGNAGRISQAAIPPQGMWIRAKSNNAFRSAGNRAGAPARCVNSRCCADP